MTIRNLEQAFNPKSLAIIGASPREGSVGRIVFENALTAGFEGPVWPVNPKYDEILGQPCYRNIWQLPGIPDLAVIATPAATVPGVVRELGEHGTRTAVVLSAGLTRENGLQQELLDAARPYLFRIIGPNTLGVISPGLGLNASFSHIAPQRGNLALLSQSGAMMTSLIDWAAARHIGFSRLFSLGNMADVDVGDCLDMLATDRQTNAILLYLESVPDPRKFISAARAAARLKPVIAIKSGRHAAAAKAAATHTGALAGADNVVEAVLQRAGVLRVNDLEELFLAAETVAHFPPLPRARIGIVTNGGGAGVLAVDALVDLGGEMADLLPATIAALDDVLPATWSRANPVDIIGDAPPERYIAAVRAVAADPNVDALLVMNCPTALAESAPAAQGLADLVDKGMLNGKPVFACWLGEQTARAAWDILHKAGIASFDTPALAVEAFAYLYRWTQAQKALRRAPESFSADTPRDRQRVAAIFAKIAKSGRAMLTEPEAKDVCRAYGIPVPDLVIAETIEDVTEAARIMLADHDSVVIKVLSDDISHKSDVGGVKLNLGSAEAVHEAAKNMMMRIGRKLPDARIEGFALQPMIRSRAAHELIVGMNHDPLFGPAILFGAGGTAVETVADTAIALPPLDDVLGRDLIAATRIGKLLKGYRDRPAADEAAILGVINAVSQLVVDFPCIKGIDINPLLADESGVIALDARIEIDIERVGETGPAPDLAIRPYPTGWDKSVTLQNGQQVHLRPIRPDDGELYPAFLSSRTSSGISTRLLAPSTQYAEDMLKRITQLDYEREMAFVALLGTDGKEELAAIVHYIADPDHERAEFGILVRADLQARGIGYATFAHMIEFARADGIKRLEGAVPADNTRMLTLCAEFGFTQESSRTLPGHIHVALDLTA